MTPARRRTNDRGQRVPSMIWWQDPATGADIEIRWEVIGRIHTGGAPAVLTGILASNTGAGEYHVWEHIDLPPTFGRTGEPFSTNWESLTNSATGLAPVGVFFPASWSAEQCLLGMTSAAPVLPDDALLLRSTGAGRVQAWTWRKESGEAHLLPLEFDADPAALIASDFAPFRPLHIGSQSADVLLDEPDPAPPEQPSPAPAAAVPVPVPTVVRLEIPKWVWASGLVLAACLLGFAAWFVLRSQRPVAEARPAPQQERINLELRRGGDGGLDVRWDGLTATRLGAQTGVLRIVDGGQLTEVPLTLADINSGKLLYVPRSGNVEVLLSLLTIGGPVQEMVRVIGGAPVQAAKPPARTPAPVAPPQAPSTPPADTQVSRDRASPTREEPARAPAEAKATPAPAMEAPPPAVVAQNTAPQPALRLDRIPEPQAARPEPVKQTPPPAPQQQAQLPVRNPVVIPPRPVKQVMPTIPAHLKQVMPQTTVITVRLTVDAQGRVIDARTEAASGLTSHLSRLARDAGRQWRFDAATLDGRAVQSEHVIHFKFGK